MTDRYKQYIIEREGDRKKYFEIDGYYKLSDIVEIETYHYQNNRDRFVIRSIITGKYTNWDADFTDIMNEHIKDPQVNWLAIYDYLDKQLKKVPDMQFLTNDLFELNKQLKPYRNDVLTVYTGF